MIYQAQALTGEIALNTVLENAGIEITIYTPRAVCTIDTTKHDTEIRADERRKFAKWLVNKGVFKYNNEITDNGNLFVLDYEKEQKNNE